MLQGLWPVLSSAQWSEALLPLIHAIAAKQRQDAVRLVSCAYSSIQPDRLASLTGTSSQEALSSVPLTVHVLCSSGLFCCIGHGLGLMHVKPVMLC